MSTAHDKSSNHGGSHLTAYYLTYLALMILLVATVACAYVHLGEFNIVVAMSIAVVKAGLVLWYFMHLKEAPKIAMFFMGMAVATLIIGALLGIPDYLFR
jgi:cytochrome c oxidase subunit IV